MLAQTRYPRLCTACRSNLLSLFVCQDPTRNSRASKSLRHPRQPNPLSRAYSKCHAWRSSISTASPNHSPARSTDNSHIHAEDSAVPTDVTPSGLDQVEEDALIEAGGGAVAELRTGGLSVESIVREARQIFGEGLPQDVLNEDEFRVYCRLYGKPVSRSKESEGDPLQGELGEEAFDGRTQQLLDRDGDAVEYQSSTGHEAKHSHGGFYGPEVVRDPAHPSTSKHNIFPSQAQTFAHSPDSLEGQAREIANQLGGELYDSEDANELAFNVRESPPNTKSHPLTNLGRFATSPRTVYLPQNAFVKAVDRLLGEFSNKHLKEVCERTFGGGGLPNSPLTPRSGRTMPQVPIPLEASRHSLSQMEANAFMTVTMTSTYAALMSVLVETRKRLGTSWLANLLAQPGGPRILDAGGGGVAVLAWREIVKAEWEALHTSDPSPPPPPSGRSVVLTGSPTLRQRAAALLQNTTFVPRLPDYIHVRDTETLEDDRPAPHRKEFDIIFAPHTIWPLKEEWERKQHVQNLWSLLHPDGGVLILLEKGVPRGFEAVAAARELLLHRYIESPDSPTYPNPLNEATSGDGPEVEKGKGMIIAPCTNHGRCPMYAVPGLSRQRKDYCSFQQRYIRPPFLQRILGATDRNDDDVDFSYLSVMKGRDLREDPPREGSSSKQGVTAPTPEEQTIAAFEGHDGLASPSPSNPDLSAEGVSDDSSLNSLSTSSAVFRQLPRLVFAPIKRPGHIILDVCTPSATIERWIVPKSYSKVAFRDARKSQWGDLWALGAKTRTPRNLNLGFQGTNPKAERRRERGGEKDDDRAGRKMIAKLKTLELRKERIREMQEKDELFSENIADISKDDVSVMLEKVNKGNEETAPRHDDARKVSATKQQTDLNLNSSRLPGLSQGQTMYFESASDTELAAIKDWEDEYVHDLRYGKKRVRSVREGTKTKARKVGLSESPVRNAPVRGKRN